MKAQIFQVDAFTGKSDYDYLVEVLDPQKVRHMNPDFGELRKLPVRGVIVTSESEEAEADFISRFFAPAVGVNEDPVTGSAHCTLAGFWAARLGRSLLVGWQASARGGRVGVEVVGHRVLLRGKAVTVLRGEWVEVSAGEDLSISKSGHLV